MDETEQSGSNVSVLGQPLSSESPHKTAEAAQAARGEQRPSGPLEAAQGNLQRFGQHESGVNSIPTPTQSVDTDASKTPLQDARDNAGGGNQ